MTSYIQFGQNTPASTEVTPVMRTELWSINSDPYHIQEIGLVQVLNLDGGLIWVHTTIIVDEGQRTTVSGKKSKCKAMAKSCNVVISSIMENDSILAALTIT